MVGASPVVAQPVSKGSRQNKKKVWNFFYTFLRGVGGVLGNFNTFYFMLLEWPNSSRNAKKIILPHTFFSFLTASLTQSVVFVMIFKLEGLVIFLPQTESSPTWLIPPGQVWPWRPTLGGAGRRGESLMTTRTCSRRTIWTVCKQGV